MGHFLMTIKNHPTPFLLLYSAVLALLFNYLFFDKEIGVSWFIFIFLVVAGQVFLLLINKRFSLDNFILLFLALFFSLMIGLRDGYLLNFLNFVTTLLLLLLSSRLFIKSEIKRFNLSDYLLSWFAVPGQIFFRAIKLLNEYLPKLFSNKKTLPLSVVKGLLASLPLLLFFVILFIGADHSFRDFINKTFTFSIPDSVIGQVLVIVVAFMASFGYFAFANNPQGHILTEKDNALLLEEELKNRKLSLLTFVWPIVSLFLVFIVFQLKYLFGAINLSDLTYAEYARHGFWELLVVTFVSVIILLLADYYSEKINKRFFCFTLPGSIMIGELFVIVASALKRMALYQENYGWTLLRFYVVSFIIFLSLILLFLFIKMIIKVSNEKYLLSVLITGVLFIGGFNVINPDAFVVNKNIEHYNKTGQIDVNYLLTLSADSIPRVIDVVEKLVTDDRQILVDGLIVNSKSLNQTLSSWQSFNLSRWRGLVLLNDYLKDK